MGVALLAGAGAVVWGYSMLQKKPMAPDATATPTLAASAPPRLLYAASDDISSEALGKLYTADVDANDIKDTGISARYHSLMSTSTSPLGHVVLVSSTGSDTKAIYTLELVKPDGTKSKIATLPMGVWPMALALSDGGKRLAYTRHRDSKAEIWSINTDGSDHGRLLDDTTYPQGDPYHLAPAQWSPDMQYLLLQPGSIGTDAPLPGTFYRLKLATGSVEQIAKPQTQGWKLGSYKPSPDGTKLAYSEYKYGAPTDDSLFGPVTATALRIADLTNGKATTVLEDNSGVVIGRINWSADGKAVAYTTSLKANESIFQVAAQGGKSQQVVVDSAKDKQIEQVAWAGDRIVYTLAGQIAGQKSELWTVKADGKATKLIASAAGVYLVGVRPQ